MQSGWHTLVLAHTCTQQRTGGGGLRLLKQKWRRSGHQTAPTCPTKPAKSKATQTKASKRHVRKPGSRHGQPPWGPKRLRVGPAACCRPGCWVGVGQERLRPQSAAPHAGGCSSPGPVWRGWQCPAALPAERRKEWGTGWLKQAGAVLRIHARVGSPGILASPRSP